MVSYISGINPYEMRQEVLILVVVDDGLVLDFLDRANAFAHGVLILVVVDDGLVLFQARKSHLPMKWGLNPCCSGRWSRTYALHQRSK